MVEPGLKFPSGSPCLAVDQGAVFAAQTASGPYFIEGNDRCLTFVEATASQFCLPRERRSTMFLKLQRSITSAGPSSNSPMVVYTPNTTAAVWEAAKAAILCRLASAMRKFCFIATIRIVRSTMANQSATTVAIGTIIGLADAHMFRVTFG